MAQRDEPDMDRVRDALREHDDRQEQERRDEEPQPAPPERDPAKDDESGQA